MLWLTITEIVYYLLYVIFSINQQSRPLGVSIIAALQILGGIIYIAAAFLFGSIGLMGGGGMDAMGGSFVTAIFVGIAIPCFIMSWGLLKGKSWAWTITLILTIIGLVMSIISLNIIGVIIDVIILYYLFRPHVKAYFGKGTVVL